MYGRNKMVPQNLLSNKYNNTVFTHRELKGMFQKCF